MEKTEKTLEQLEAEAKKAIDAVQAASEKLESAQKELAVSPDDGALKKKVQGLTLAHKNAAEKAEAAQKALQDAQEKNAETQKPNAQGENTPAETSGEKTPKNQGDGTPDNNAGAENSGSNSGDSGTKKIRIRCRSKTGKPSYFRAGLRFTPVDAEYEVTEEVSEILKNDPWLDGKTIE